MIFEGFWPFWVETATPDGSEIVFSSYWMYLSPQNHPLHVKKNMFVDKHFGQKIIIVSTLPLTWDATTTTKSSSSSSSMGCSLVSSTHIVNVGKIMKIKHL